MGLFQSILDTPVNMQFQAPPPVQLLPPHSGAQAQSQQGTGGSATDAILGKVGLGGAPAAGGAAAGGDAAGAAGAGGNSGIMQMIMQMLPMIMGG